MARTKKMFVKIFNFRYSQKFQNVMQEKIFQLNLSFYIFFIWSFPGAVPAQHTLRRIDGREPEPRGACLLQPLEGSRPWLDGLPELYTEFNQQLGIHRFLLLK